MDGLGTDSCPPLVNKFDANDRYPSQVERLDRNDTRPQLLDEPESN